MFKKVASLVVFSAIFSLLNINSVSALNTEDYYFESMNVDYHLSVGKDNHSVLKVEETLVPVFPDYDQNHGIERNIPLKYDGHKLKFELEEVTLDGETGVIAKEDESDNHYRMKLGRASEYLKGRHVFKIKYTLQDVTHKPKDNSNIQEFYWDVNGVDWRQTFQKVTVTLQIDQKLANKIIDQQACYTGRQGSSAQNCQIKRDGNKYSVTTTQPLSRHENLSLAVAFKSDTFANYKKTFEDYFNQILPYLLSGGSFLISIVTIILRMRIKTNKVAKPYPAQYLPMPDNDIFLESELINSTKRVAAGLVDLAIKRKIDITERKKEGVLGFKSKEHSIKVIDAKSLTSSERTFLANFLVPENGSSYTFAKDDYAVSRKLTSYNVKQTEKMMTKGYYSSKNNTTKMYAFLNLIGAALAFFGGVWVSGLTTLNTLAAVYNFLTILTKKGAALKTHLLGMKKYIKMSETERLAFAQSVTTAERKALTGEDGQAKIVLYERLLPYAIMFGLEKTWAKELEVLYEQNPNYQPTWYDGASVAGAMAIANSISSFNSSISSSSASSSSSSGSSGGGFSGGGGGGGGGGGW